MKSQIQNPNSSLGFGNWDLFWILSVVIGILCLLIFVINFKMDLRRIKLLGMVKPRMRSLIYLLTQKKFNDAYTYLWASTFTRDAGLALLDPLIRIFPWLAPYPKQFEIEVTTRCPLKCTICEHTYWDEPGRDMSFEEFKKIVDQFPGLKWIGMTGIGSSFLNKDFLSMLRYVKAKHVFVELFDTFYLMDKQISEQLIDMGVDKICISLEAATKETYEKIRIGSDLDRVIENIRQFVRLREQKGTPLPELWFHFIITKDNVYEMLPFVDFVYSIIEEMKNPWAIIYWTNLLHFKEVEHLHTNIPLELRKAIDKKARKLNIFTVWNENVTRSKPISHCTKWTEPFVLVTGHVQPCCAINEANERGFQKWYSFANLLETSFKEVWYSQGFKEFKRKLQKGEVPIICKNCRLYYF